MPEPRDNNGLLPEQREPFKRWLTKEVDDALKYLNGQWEPPPPENGETHTVQEIKAAKAKEEARPLFKEVEQIVKDSAGDEATLIASLAKLKEDKLKIAVEGPHKKGFGEILMEALLTLNPVAIIMAGVQSMMSGQGFFSGISNALQTAFIGVVKDAAVSFGTDSTAGWMKAFKDNFATWWKGDSWSFDNWGTKTTEQASAELRQGMGMEAVAASLVSDPKAIPGVAAAISEGVDGERKTPSQTPAGAGTDAGHTSPVGSEPIDPALNTAGNNSGNSPAEGDASGAGASTAGKDEVKDALLHRYKGLQAADIELEDKKALYVVHGDVKTGADGSSKFVLTSISYFEKDQAGLMSQVDKRVDLKNNPEESRSFDIGADGKVPSAKILTLASTLSTQPTVTQNPPSIDPAAKTSPAADPKKDGVKKPVNISSETKAMVEKAVEAAAPYLPAAAALLPGKPLGALNVALDMFNGTNGVPPKGTPKTTPPGNPPAGSRSGAEGR